jgi:hypothetical protein
MAGKLKRLKRVEVNALHHANRTFGEEDIREKPA